MSLNPDALYAVEGLDLSRGEIEAAVQSGNLRLCRLGRLHFATGRSLATCFPNLKG